MEQDIMVKHSTETISTKIIAVIIDILKPPAEQMLSEDTLLADDLGLDSMSTLAFLMALEDAIEGFRIDPDTLEAKHFVSIKTISEYVLVRLEQEQI